VPLLAISEACGWKAAGLKAALAVEAVADMFDPSTGVQLLHAIKEAFETRCTDRISSTTLVADLIADETSPWATWNRGKPISQRQVASVLKPFGVKPGSIKLDPGSDKTAKGYLFAWLKDAFSRFCALSASFPQFHPALPAPTCFHKTFPHFHPAPRQSGAG
jgi:hypothetical protein